MAKFINILSFKIIKTGVLTITSNEFIELENFSFYKNDVDCKTLIFIDKNFY